MAENREIENEGVDGFPDVLFNLHSSLPTQSVFISSREERINPRESTESGDSLFFYIKGSQNEFLLANETRLLLTIKLLKLNNTPFAAGAEADKCIPVNSIGTAIFKNLRVKINNKMITKDNGNYSFQADIENKLFTTKQNKIAELSKSGYYEENASFDGLEVGPIFTDGIEPNLSKRRNKMIQSSSYQVCAKIHSEIFDQIKPFPPNIEFFLEFQFQPDKFVLLKKGDDLAHKIKIEKAQLQVYYGKCDSDVTNQFLSITEEISLKYPIRRVEVSSHIYGPAVAEIINNTTFKNKDTVLPRRIFLAFTRQDSYMGNHQRDPFAYDPFDIESASITIGGNQTPYAEMKSPLEMFNGLQRAIEPNFEGSNFYNGITIDNYQNGRNFILGWDLFPIKTTLMSSFSLPRYDSVCINLRFARALPVAIVMLVYCEYEAELTIDKEGIPTISENAL